MPKNYIYYGDLTLRQFKKFHSVNALSLVQNPTTKSDLHISRIKNSEQLIELSLNLLILISTYINVAQGNDDLSNSFCILNRTVEAININLCDLTSRKTSLFTGVNQEVNIPLNQIELTALKIYDDGKCETDGNWAHYLPPSEGVKSIEETAYSTENSEFVIRCWIVSPLPPEIIIHDKRLQYGLISLHEDLAKKIAALNLNWSPHLQKMIPHAFSDLVNILPDHLLVLVHPSALLINDLAIYQQYKALRAILKEIAAKKIALESIKVNIAQELIEKFLHAIPVLSRTNSKDRELKAITVLVDTYSIEAQNYKQKLVAWIIKHSNSQHMFVTNQKLLNRSIYENTVYKLIEDIPVQYLILISPRLFLKNLNQLDAHRAILKTLNDSYEKSDLEGYRYALLNALYSLITNFETVNFESNLSRLFLIEKQIQSNLDQIFSLLTLKEASVLNFSHFQFLMDFLEFDAETRETFKRRYYENINKPEIYAVLFLEGIAKSKKLNINIKNNETTLHEVNFYIYSQIVLYFLFKSPLIVCHAMSLENVFRGINKDDYFTKEFIFKYNRQFARLQESIIDVNQFKSEIADLILSLKNNDNIYEICKIMITNMQTISSAENISTKDDGYGKTKVFVEYDGPSKTQFNLFLPLNTFAKVSNPSDASDSIKMRNT